MFYPRHFFSKHLGLQSGADQQTLSCHMLIQGLPGLCCLQKGIRPDRMCLIGIIIIIIIIIISYYENHVFSGVYIYNLVLPEPTNSQNEESKRVLHGLCSPSTGKTVLLQAVQIQLLLLRNERRDVHRPASTAR